MLPQFFKKGDKADPSNYRPISLPCVFCKVLEHIVASSLANHFTELDILYELQHGFQEKRSCKTQLIMLTDELSKTMQMGTQTDLILLDFSKAFNKVAHEKFILKLHHYGIRGDTLKWIKDVLDNRKQAVVILFLAYINDQSDQVKSRVRLFADDTAMYLAITSLSDSLLLQQDLHKMEQLEKMWVMSPVLKIPFQLGTSYMVSSWKVFRQQSTLGSPSLMT